MPAREVAVLAHLVVDRWVALELVQAHGPLDRAVVGGHVVAPSPVRSVGAEVVLRVAHPGDVPLHLVDARNERSVVVDQCPRAVDVGVQRRGKPGVPVGAVARPVGFVDLVGGDVGVRVGVRLDVQPRVQGHVADEPWHVEREVPVVCREAVDEYHLALEEVHVAVEPDLELGCVREHVLQPVRGKRHRVVA